VLDLRGLGNADVIVFLSSAASATFDHTLTNAQVEAVTVGFSNELHLSQMKSLPVNLMIDRVRVRATSGATCVVNVCVRDGRTIDPTRNLANFTGTPEADDNPPTVISAVSVDDTRVLMTFSEPLRPEAANPANFSISPELAVLAAVLTDRQNQILLTTAPQEAGVVYTVTVTGIFDKAGNAVVAGSGDSAVFVYRGAAKTAWFSRSRSVTTCSSSRWGRAAYRSMRSRSAAARTACSTVCPPVTT